jgi:hypothetical protein
MFYKDATEILDAKVQGMYGVKYLRQAGALTTYLSNTATKVPNSQEINTPNRQVMGLLHRVPGIDACLVCN